MSAPTVRSADELAADLFGRRDELLRALPRRIAPARNLDPEQREMVVVDAATYVAVEHRKPITTAEEAEEIFWQRAYHLALRAVDKRRRHALVRGRFERVGYTEVLEHVAANDADDPAELAEAAVETAVIREFIASLSTLEQQVWRVKWAAPASVRHPGQGLGYRAIAERLGIPSARVRKAERDISAKLDRFSVLLAAGRLCDERATDLDALAASVANPLQSNRAHAHLEQCGACRSGFNAQLRAMRSAAFNNKVAALIPPAPVADDRIRSQFAEWFSSVVGHNADAAAGTATQAAASGVGRGATGVLAAKVAAVLAAGATTIGATTGLFHRDSSEHRARPVARPTPAPVAFRPTPTPTPIATPDIGAAVRKAGQAAQRHQRAVARRQAASPSGPRGHEKSIISPAPVGSQPNGQSEFDIDSGANLPAAPPAPANTAPGASEFGP